jgi:hypothetical protein
MLNTINGQMTNEAKVSPETIEYGSLNPNNLGKKRPTKKATIINISMINL